MLNTNRLSIVRIDGDYHLIGSDQEGRACFFGLDASGKLHNVGLVDEPPPTPAATLAIAAQNKEPEEIAADLHAAGFSWEEIGAAFQEAAERSSTKGNRLIAEGRAFKDIRKAAAAPGAENIAQGLRQRASTGDKKAQFWLDTLLRRWPEIAPRMA
jgi:hypothetical protein